MCRPESLADGVVFFFLRFFFFFSRVRLEEFLREDRGCSPFSNEKTHLLLEGPLRKDLGCSADKETPTFSVNLPFLCSVLMKFYRNFAEFFRKWKTFGDAQNLSKIDQICTILEIIDNINILSERR